MLCETIADCHVFKNKKTRLPALSFRMHKHTFVFCAMVGWVIEHEGHQQLALGAN